MKLYLAGPMRGYPDENRQMFEEWARELRAAGYEVWSPVGYNDQYPDTTLRERMAADLGWICKQAEGIALLQGWVMSRGTLAEVATAAALGDVPCRSAVEWVQMSGRLVRPVLS